MKEKKKFIIHGREFWLTYEEMKEALGIEDEETARKIWESESAKSRTFYCNPPEDCKRCAYAPLGSELCESDYVVWIIENETEKKVGKTARKSERDET